MRRSSGFLPRLAARAGIALASCSLFVFAAPAAGANPQFSYPDFSSVAGLQLNGDAIQQGNVLQLTPALQNRGGSAYSTTPIDPQQSFNTQFQISMHDSTCCIVGGTLQPADGMAFVIQNQGLDAGRGLGGSMGYSGISPSMEVEFDLYHNLGVDPPGTHVSIMTDGNAVAHLQCANEGGPTAPCTGSLPFSLYGAPVYTWVEYDATSGHLKVFVSQSSTQPSAPLLDYPISMSSLGTSAYAGFTAATGAHNAVHDVLNWQFGEPPVAAPAPILRKAARCHKAKRGKGKAKGHGRKAGASRARGKRKGSGKGKKCGKKKGHRKTGGRRGSKH